VFQRADSGVVIAWEQRGFDDHGRPGNQQLPGHAEHHVDRRGPELLGFLVVDGAEAIEQQFLELILRHQRPAKLAGERPRERGLPRRRIAVDDEQHRQGRARTRTFHAQPSSNNDAMKAVASVWTSVDAAARQRRSALARWRDQRPPA